MKNSISKKIKQFISDYYPTERTILFTGSVSIEKGYPDSDIDLLILTDRYHYPHTSKVKDSTLDFHVKVIPVNRITEYLFLERTADTPVLIDMISKGRFIVDLDKIGGKLKKLASELYSLGPHPISFELEHKYLLDISRSLETIKRNSHSKEKIFVIGDLLNKFSEYVLLKSNKWPHTAKKRKQQLDLAFPNLSGKLFEALKDSLSLNNTKVLVSIIEEFVILNGGVNHYFTTKNVDELRNYSKNYFCIYIPGLQDDQSFFNIVKKLLDMLKVKDGEYYFYRDEDIRNKIPSFYFLTLLKPDLIYLVKNIEDIRSFLIKNFSSVNLIYPSNHMGFIHERQNSKSFLSLFVMQSKFVYERVIQKNQLRHLPFLIIKCTSKFLDRLNKGETLQVLNVLYQKWLSAAIDINNYYDQSQQDFRRSETHDMYQSTVSKITENDGYVSLYREYDQQLENIVAIAVAGFEASEAIPTWFLTTGLKDDSLKIAYWVEAMMKGFMVSDNHKAYLYLAVKRNLESLLIG